MAAKSPQAQSSGVQFDGAMNVNHILPRVATATTAATDNAGSFVAHGPLTIQKLLLHVLASVAASTALIKIGNRSSASAYHGPISLAGKVTGSYVEVDMTASNWVKTDLAKGDYLKFSAPAIATLAFAGVMVLGPTALQSQTASVG